MTRKQKKRLESLDVRIMYLFGSQAEGMAQDISDYDFAVLLSPHLQNEDNLNSTYDALYDLLSDLGTEASLDILFLHRVNLELQYDVITHGRIVYEASSDERIDYEDRITMLYLDFQPILRECDQTLLQRIF